MTAKKLKGQTLIEIVLSLGLATSVIVAIVILGTATLKTTTSSSRRAEATKLSSSGVEAIRYLRDSSGFDSVSITCYTISENNVIKLTDSECDTSLAWDRITLGTNNIFDRKIEVSQYAGTNMKKVTSTVRWQEAGGYRQVVISTVFSKW